MTTPSRQKRVGSFVGGLIPPSSRKTSVAENGAVKKGHSYERLAKAFTLSGFGYRLIAREGNWAIYEQRWPHSARRSDDFSFGALISGKRSISIFGSMGE